MEVLYGFKAEDIVQEGRITWEEIETIKEWNKVVKVPKLSDEQIVHFILSCERDLEFSKKTILEYYKARTHCNLFNNRDVDSEESQSQINTLEYIFFPTRTETGELIIYHKLTDTTYYKYNMGPSMKLLFMTLDAAIYKRPPTGLIILFDMKGVSLMHLTRIRIGLIKAFCHYCQEALPVKLKAIHVLNTQYFIDKVMMILKPFLKKELYEMLHFHPPSLDLEKFSETFVPKNCLPIEYGGSLPSTQEMHQENTKILRDLKEFFDAEEHQRDTFFKDNK